IDYAMPFYMTRGDGTGVNYADPAQELQAYMFDPAYYIDVLVQAIELWIKVRVGTEPGFRSTGFERSDLSELYRQLGDFIAAWEQSILLTRLVGPIDPAISISPTGDAGHLLHHPYADPGRAIPMGVIDQVSGVTLFEPNYSDGFDLAFNNTTMYPSDPSGY